MSYGDEAAQQYGSLRAFLEKQGAPIGSLDMLIAAHALSTDCILVTNNAKAMSNAWGGVRGVIPGKMSYESLYQNIILSGIPAWPQGEKNAEKSGD